MTPATYYKSYQADDKISALSERLITEIMEFNPVHVLDMAAGTGKHLKMLHELGVVTFGIDISPVNVAIAIFKHGLPSFALGDHSYLRFCTNYDVVTTCSFLDHVEFIDDIINEFKRICNKAVVLAEPQHHEPELFYWSHDYESFGFKKTNFSWVGEDGVTYFIWIWLKGSDVEDSHLKHKEG